MTKPTGKPVGRPRKPATVSLGGVRIPVELFADLDKAARLEGVTRTDYVNKQLGRAIKRTLKRHEP